jgi:hypothetical protein
MNVTQGPITHTVGAWSVFPTLSSVRIDAFCSSQPSFTDICFKDFHCNAQQFARATFHFYK